MKLTCPHCGFHASLEAFLLDTDAKAAVVAASALPGDLGRLVWSYLGLFRKPDAKQVMTWQRAGRLIQELHTLVNDPQIQWDGGRVVPGGAAYWGQAIQRVLDMPALRRPLEGHNLIRKIAYELAEKAWHQGNVAREQQARHRVGAGRHTGLPQQQPTYQPVPLAEALKDWRKRLNGEQRDHQTND